MVPLRDLRAQALLLLFPCAGGALGGPGGDGPWVAREDDDERGEREEGERVEREDVHRGERGRVVHAVVVVDEDEEEDEDDEDKEEEDKGEIIECLKYLCSYESLQIHTK